MQVTQFYTSHEKLLTRIDRVSVYPVGDVAVTENVAEVVPVGSVPVMVLFDEVKVAHVGIDKPP